MSKGGPQGCWRLWRGSCMRSSWGHLVCSAWRRDWAQTSLGSAVFSQEEVEGQVPISPLWWPVTGLEEMAWSWVRGGLGWTLGRGFSPRGWLDTEQAPREVVTAPSLTEFKECLDKALRHKVWFLGCPVQGQWSLWVPSNLAYSMIWDSCYALSSKR